jgi:hypothetical protein
MTARSQGYRLARDKRRLTVDTAHLLGNHDGRSTIICPPNPRYRETVPQAREIADASSLFELFRIDDPRVVKVSCGDDGMSS